ncbi:MAG: hypothetical protein N3G74_00330 [Candidatus Micrarchaeota archaeon]|nr:hypothetical protein [Candidatus Micrarchaeota archaeon]
MSYFKFGRKIFRETEMSLSNIDTGEKIKKTVIFSNMLMEDLPYMQEIHNRAWEADKYPSLCLDLSQFQSYYENCREYSIAALIINEDDPSKSIPVGGICAMPINMVTIAGNWDRTEGDDYPLTWNECTNYGYFDTKRTRGTLDRIWPCKEGSSIICPTVFVKPKVKIGEGVYSLGSLMKEIILAVNNMAKEKAETEKRKIRIYAYSAPRRYDYYYKDLMDREGKKLDIRDYLLMSTIKDKIETEWRNCLEAAGLGRNPSPQEIENSFEAIKRAVKERGEEIYEAYKLSGGDLPKQEFEEKEIFLSYSILGPGKAAYDKFVSQFEIFSPKIVFRSTARSALDPVIGRHLSFGADIKKIVPQGRIDPNSRNYNVIMKYPSAVPETTPKAEVTKIETKPIDLTM